MGRRTSSPAQFGHTPFNRVATQSLQNVHSNEQIQARIESGGRSPLQHSQPGLSNNIAQIIAERTAASEYRRSSLQALGSPRARRAPVTLPRPPAAAGIWFSLSMNAPLPTTFPKLVHSFFGDYLPRQRGLSSCTVASYRDAFLLFLGFVQSRSAKPAESVTLTDFTPEQILAFLEHLEQERRNTIHSRNIRLAALRAFLKFAAPWDVSPLHGITRSLEVPAKRFIRPKPDFLSRVHMLAVIGTPDGTWLGHRDHMLLSLLYNTGATVSEIVALRVADMQLGDEARVRIAGKGGRRFVPLWPATIATVKSWLTMNPQFNADSLIVPNQLGKAMTSSCVRRRILLAARRAARHEPELARRRISPRVIRHTAAMHLLQCGTDVSLITRWLGHQNPATMHNHARAYRLGDGSAARVPHAEALAARTRASGSLLEFLKAL
jgi:site-specific recombinase XerD